MRSSDILDSIGLDQIKAIIELVKGVVGCRVDPYNRFLAVLLWHKVPSGKGPETLCAQSAR